ncbi:hypothetical protein B0O80DRAFT_250462 [Mortierella sp. GBAus27b]|nr:hypothetical protein B0O80DRAFT_250462 [Mortierella sp. GBAus27b]
MSISAWIYVLIDTLFCSSAHRVCPMLSATSATPSTHLRPNIASRPTHALIFDTWQLGSKLCPIGPPEIPWTVLLECDSGDTSGFHGFNLSPYDYGVHIMDNRETCRDQSKVHEDMKLPCTGTSLTQSTLSYPELSILTNGRSDTPSAHRAMAFQWSPPPRPIRQCLSTTLAVFAGCFPDHPCREMALKLISVGVEYIAPRCCRADSLTTTKHPSLWWEQSSFPTRV